MSATQRFSTLAACLGTDPRVSQSLGTLYDVGFGLRLSSSRASGKSVVHIDLAFPLNGDSDGRHDAAHRRREKARSNSR